MCPRRLASDPLFPKAWPRVARAAVLHAVSLASTAMAVVRGRARRSRSQQRQQITEIEQLGNEITLLREELRAQRCPNSCGAAATATALRGWSLDERENLGAVVRPTLVEVSNHKDREAL